MKSSKPARVLRLDKKVVNEMPQLSRSFASKLVAQGKVSVNGQTVSKQGYKFKNTDKIIINYDITEVNRIPEIELAILYEDDDCLVINKPIGLLTHSKGVFNPEATVASWLHNRYTDPLNERAGIVHRLDRATSGVMICAKNNKSSAWLQKQFSQRKVKKTYLAIVNGIPAPAEAVIDMPIERNPKAPATFRVGVNGKSAITRYKIIKSTKHYTLIALFPQTGRTHQLRVHLNQLGFPIVGDTFYNGESCDRLYLHAHQLEITLPNHSRQTFTAILPAEFHKIMNKS